MGVGDEHVAVLAVLAHGLLNSMTAVIAGIDVALDAEELPPEAAAALRAARRQAHHVDEALRQLVRGVPPDTVDLTSPPST